jgi:hypothetical protein
MKRISPFIAILALVAATASAQTLQRSVISNGAVRARGSGNTTMQATLGQGVIGYSARPSGEIGSGFWYRPAKAITKVIIPNSEGEIGTVVTVPVILSISKNILRDGPREVLVKLRYNRTVLVHKGSQPVVFNGDDAIMTITATVRDSVGIIAELPFLVALGAVEKSPLEILSVEWPRGGFIRTFNEDGEFAVLGLCREGDTVRLIKRGTGTGIIGVSPNPIVSDAVVTFSAAEAGPYKLILVDALGRPHAELADAEFSVGRHEIPVPAAFLPSGQYFLVLMNGRQTYSRSVIIGK